MATIKRQAIREFDQEMKENERQFLDGVDPEDLWPSGDEMPKLLDGSDYDWGSFDWPTDRD